MAITRTQIAKQLLAQGGRTGFQGGGKDLGTASSKDFGFGNREARDDKAIEKRMRNIGKDSPTVVVPPPKPPKPKKTIKEKFVPPALKFLNFLGGKLSTSKPGMLNNALQIQNYLRTLSPEEQVEVLEDLAAINIGTANPMGITRNIDRGMENKGFLGTGIGGGKFITDIALGGPEAKAVLGEGYTKYQQEQRDRFTPDDKDGLQDPCLGPNPPAYCFVGIRSAAPVVEDTEYVNPLSKLTPRIAGTQFAAEGGRIGLRGGDAARSDAASGRDAGRADPSGGVDDRSTRGQTAVNDAAIMMARMQNQNLDSITNPKFTKKFSKTSPIFSNFNKMALNKMIANANLNALKEEEREDQTKAAVDLSNLIRNVPEIKQRISDTVYGIMDNPDIANLGKISTTGFAGGGIASLEDMDREGFVLGGIAKGLKKAVRGIKKLAKSPIGKAALGFAALKYGGGFGGLKTKLFGTPGYYNIGSALHGSGVGKAIASNPGLLGKLGLTAGGGSMALTGKGVAAAIGIPSILAGAMTPKEDKDKFDIDSYYASGQTGNVEPFPRIAGSKFDFYGSRIASAEGGSTEKKEPVAKKTMPLLDMDGMEKDYREDGGFVPIGRMEKADDVPARLSKNEFVFTADAVRNAGDGDVDKGAEVMYNMMKNLESGGDVSEESQGLEGARKMFQTSQRLEEVL